MTEFLLPYSMRMSIAEDKATPQKTSYSPAVSPALKVNTEYTPNASGSQPNLNSAPPEKPEMDCMQSVESLLYFFRTLLVRTDTIDRQHNLTFNRSVSERIKVLIHRLVNYELKIPEFARLVQSTVCSNATSELLPFLYKTVPPFIDAIANARISIEWLLPYYLKPCLHGPSEKNFSTPSSEDLCTPLGEMPDDHDYTARSGIHLGVQFLQPANCAENTVSVGNTMPSSNDLQAPKECIVIGMKEGAYSATEVEPIDWEKTSREALSDLFLHPKDMLKCIQQCMGEGCYVEEEALQMISEAAQIRMHEFLTELVDVAAHRLHLKVAAPQNIIPNSDSHQIEQKVEIPIMETPSSDNRVESNVTTTNVHMANGSVSTKVCDTTENTIKTTTRKFKRRMSNIHKIYKTHEREPWKTYQKVVRVTTHDLQFVVLHDRRFAGKTLQFKAVTGCFTSHNT